MPVHTADDGCRLFYVLSGRHEAPALVLSNSLGTSHRLWDAQLDRLERLFRVLRYDTRGHGDSGAPAGDYSLSRLGRDVLSLMDHVAMTRAHIGGISLGGITALWLAVHAPDRVNRLLLANTAARIGSTESWGERMQLVTNGGMAAIADATMERWFTRGFREAHPAAVAGIRAMLLVVPATGYLGCCAALRDADLRPRTRQVCVPTLVITGTHDPATPPEDGRWLAGTLPAATLVEFDAAHLTNVECAQGFTDAVTQFLTA